MRDIILDIGWTEHALDPQGRTYLELASTGAYQAAIEGSVVAFRELCDRIDGKPAPWQPDDSPANHLSELVRALQEPDEEKPRRCSRCHRHDGEDEEDDE